MIKVNVQASRGYDVIIEKGILSRAGELISAVTGASRLVLVCDSTVDSLYAKKVLCQLPVDTVKFVFPAGEKSKNIETLSALLEFMAVSGIGRGDAVVALGGGVTGDLAGFAAAVYMRGIDFVQIPTTLLAMVDSSVGGKTAVDLAAGKNLCGAFWQPRLVICDPDTLETLPRSIYKDGMAEVVKYAAIRDGGLIGKLLSGFAEEEMIARCVQIKSDIVREDERENGVRAILNFGHTPAHAIEKLSGYGISHGAAVAAGMIIMARASAEMGFCGKDTAVEIISAAEKLCQPEGLCYTAKELAREALGDKKRRGDSISLVMLKKTGEAFLYRAPVAELEQIFGLGLR